jgi:CO/xanthine dehydrogenase Mo-binding subunit
VYNAVGVRMRNLPMTPASVLEVLGRVPRQELSVP